MTDIWGNAGGLAIALAMGAAFGAIYFALLWRWTRAVVQGGFGAGRLALGYVVRLGLAAGALALALWAGAAAGQVLAGVLGFTIARQAVLRRQPRQE